MHLAQHTSVPAPLARLAGCACLAALGTACSGEAEVVVAKPAVPVVYEIETNDEAWQANDLGALKPFDALELRGSISDDGFDPYDGFAFRAEAPLRLRFELVAIDGADLDLHLYDPWLAAFVASWDCSCGVERGTLEVPAGAEFQLVVAAWAGKSRWSLRLAAEPLDQLQAPVLRGAEQALPPALERVRGYADEPVADEPVEAQLDPLGLAYAIDAMGRVRRTLLAMHGARLLVLTLD